VATAGVQQATSTLVLEVLLEALLRLAPGVLELLVAVAVVGLLLMPLTQTALVVSLSTEAVGAAQVRRMPPLDREQAGHPFLVETVVLVRSTQATQQQARPLVVVEVVLKLVTPVLAAAGVLSSQCGK